MVKGAELSGKLGNLITEALFCPICPVYSDIIRI